MHAHACHNCGAIWEHDAPPEGTTRREFMEMHTCPQGHLCTVKFSPEVAAGIRAAVQQGVDALAYIESADPDGHYLLTRSNR